MGREEMAPAVSTARNKLPRAGRIFSLVAVTTARCVGALQMFRVRSGLVTDYGADCFGPAWACVITRRGRETFQRGRSLGVEMTALIIFLLRPGWEYGQRFHRVPGRRRL